MRFLLSLFLFFSLSFSSVLDDVLNELEKTKEELIKERNELLNSSSDSERLKLVEDAIKKVEEVEKVLNGYKERLGKGKGSVKYDQKEGDLAKVLREVLSIKGKVDANLEYSGEEGAVLGFVGSVGRAFVFGTYEEDFFGGKRRFVPKWGVVVFDQSFVLTEEDEGWCYYTGNARGKRRGGCPSVVSLNRIGLSGTDGKALQLTAGSLSDVKGKVVEIEVPVVVRPKGTYLTVSLGSDSFPLYLAPEVEFNSFVVKVPKLR